MEEGTSLFSFFLTSFFLASKSDYFFSRTWFFKRNSACHCAVHVGIPISDTASSYFLSSASLSPPPPENSLWLPHLGFPPLAVFVLPKANELCFGFIHLHLGFTLLFKYSCDFLVIFLVSCIFCYLLWNSRLLEGRACVFPCPSSSPLCLVTCFERGEEHELWSWAVLVFRPTSTPG